MHEYKLPSQIRTAFVPKTTNMFFDSVNKGINKIWKGFVVTSTNTMEQAYIKQVSDINELYREIICSLLGRAIGINTPEPLIVKVELNHPNIPTSKDTIFFGTIDCSSPPFTRYIHDNELFDDEILKYKDLHKILCFDELIANTDRHLGNVLFNGLTYNFIDHGRTFPPDLNYNESLIQCDWGTNQLADIFADKNGQNDIKVRTILSKIKKFIEAFLCEDQVLYLDECSNISKDDLNTHHKSIKSFLIKRLPLLISHVTCSVKNSHDPLQPNLTEY